MLLSYLCFFFFLFDCNLYDVLLLRRTYVFCIIHCFQEKAEDKNSRKCSSRLNAPNCDQMNGFLSTAKELWDYQASDSGQIERNYWVVVRNNQHHSMCCTRFSPLIK